MSLALSFSVPAPRRPDKAKQAKEQIQEYTRYLRNHALLLCAEAQWPRQDGALRERLPEASFSFRTKYVQPGLR